MKHKLLVILGPTSTGKTDLALEFAKKLNGELVAADSRQVYKYLDIGTGKEVSSEYQVLREKEYWVVNGVKIWMYDVADPKVRFNLYQYILKTEEIISKISESGKLPILAGGTGLYIRSLLEGVSDFGTAEDTALRLELERLSLEEIRQKLRPDILKNLNNSELNNKRRLARIYEKLQNPDGGNSFPGLQKDFDILKIGLKADKKILDERIRERVIKRMDQGMVEEAQHLLKRKVLSFKRMEELGLEYRYLAKLLKKEVNLEEFIEILSTKIRQFAKRQMTWFKKDEGVVWFDITDPRYKEKVESLVINWYNNN